MRLSRLLLLMSWAGLLGACAGSHGTTSHAPRGFWRPNRFDHDGRAQGRWRTYDDEPANTQLFTAGRYRHGRPVRTLRYYTSTGSLDHLERYGRQGFCAVKYWYASGWLARAGQAPRFYWFGPWTSYDEAGQIIGLQTFTNGSLTRAETYAAGQLTKVESYSSQRLTTIELYENGQLRSTETYENNVRVGTKAP